MTTDQLKTIEAVENLWAIAGIPESERSQYRAGLHILAELGWPASFIKHSKMYLRAERGQVAQYKDITSWLEYQSQFAEKDQGDKLERELKLSGPRQP